MHRPIQFGRVPGGSWISAAAPHITGDPEGASESFAHVRPPDAQTRQTTRLPPPVQARRPADKSTLRRQNARTASLRRAGRERWARQRKFPPASAMSARAESPSTRGVSRDRQLLPLQNICKHNYYIKKFRKTQPMHSAQIILLVLWHTHSHLGLPPCFLKFILKTDAV